MSTRDLKYSYVSMPQIVRHYISAHKIVFGKKSWVHNSKWPLFRTFEDDLRDWDIPPRDYAYIVVSILRKFCKSKNLRSVPINLFMSDYAMKRFLKVYESDTVEIIYDTNGEEVLYNELMVAREFVSRYIKEGYVRLVDVVEEMRPLLSDQWKSLYDDGGKRPVEDVIEILEVELGIKGAKSYSDVVDAMI